MLTVLLAAALVPAVPFVHEGETAEGLEGSTDYSKVFAISNHSGYPSLLTDNVLRLAHTSDSSGYTRLNENTWESSSGFISRDALRFYNSWSIVLTAKPGTVTPVSGNSRIGPFFTVGLSSHNNLATVNGYGWYVDRTYERGGWQSTQFTVRQVSGGFPVGDALRGPWSTSWGSTMRLDYDAIADTISFQNGSTRDVVTNVRSLIGSYCYVYLAGGISWTNENGASSAVPSAVGHNVAFGEMTLPRLSPVIENVTLYRSDGVTPVGKDDTVAPGELLKVACRVRNTNSASVSGSFKEQYPMHFRIVNNDVRQTLGIQIDRSYSVTFSSGDSGSWSQDARALVSEEGAPLTLYGTDPLDITYFVRASSDGTAVVLSQELVEDTFKGIQASTVRLVNEHPFDPAPDGVDPSDPSSGAGTAWHYTRLPKANGNGWNVSPVTLTFYPGITTSWS
ncbi:hypothetical protein [uncultured Adlercreutzia sp.]|uniref:hypothetical protein n=1 Tax=uncultured Adlercreutzia sp. TaxID=875803 RepID=UPI0026F3A935|nr:hypothetical protein [uncultured Adlercreutzia sp.]